RTYPIRRADIRTIEQTLNRLAREGSLSEPRQGGAPPVPVSITAEPVSDTLVVTGDSTTFEKVEQLLEELQAVPIERELRIIRIANADPQEVADQALSIYEAQIEEVPDAQPVDVQVDRSTNSLMLIAEPQSIARFVGIINQLEQNIIGPDQEVNLIALEHADAAEVVAFLRDLAESSRSFQTTQPGPQPAFEVIERTNSVLVAAQPVHYQLIRSLIRELDVLEDQDLPPVRILQVETADATLLAGTLAQVYNSRPAEQRSQKPVSIRADSNLNALLLSAHPEPFEEISGIVSELNDTRSRATSGREIRIFPLSVARAEELARTLDQMFPDPPVPLDRRGRPMFHLQGPREVVVRADAQTNSIIVDAPVERMAGFEELVSQLDKTEVTSDTEIRTYPIAHADLNSVRNAVNDLVARGALAGQVAGRRNVPITVNSEPMSQTLIIGGPVEIFPEVERILADLDARPDRPATVMKFYTLNNARADRVVSLLREVLVTRMETEYEDLRGVDLQSLLDITSDTKTNTIIISAPETLIPVTETLIEQLDSASASLEDPTIRIVPLTFADASSVARTLNTTLPNVISNATREPIDVRIVPSEASNALVLVGLPADLDEVVTLVEPLDARPGLDATIAETFALEYADAATIAPVVQRLLVDQQRMDPRLIQLSARYRWLRDSLNLGEGSIRVEADARTNQLIVSGPQATVALAGTLIDQLDTPDHDGERTLATFTPEKAEPRRLAQTVSRLLNTGNSRQSPVDLISDGPAGSVVAVGPESAVSEAIDLLAQFDADTPAMPQTDLQLFRLQFADPNTLVSTLSRVLRDESRWPESLRQASRAGVSMAQPSVSAEPNTGRLLVSAPRDLMPLAREVISQFDTDQREDEIAREFRVFNLTNAQADSVANTLREMINLERGLPANTRPGSAGAARLAPYIAAENSTNTIVVSAVPEDMASIERLIEPLDEGASADTQRVRTLYLEHARADRVAPIVEQLLRGEQLSQWVAIDLFRRGRELPDLGPDVRVAAETRLNAVIVSAPASVLSIAEELVRQLDVDAAEDAVQRPVRVIALRQTEAQQMLSNLQAVFADDEATGERPPIIRVDETSNSLIVRATDSQYATIDGLVRELEDATLVGSRQVRMIPIDRSRATAAQTAETLQRLLQQRSGMEVEVISVDELIRRQEGKPSTDGAMNESGNDPNAGAMRPPLPPAPPVGPNPTQTAITLA
ncbi:MAG: secretin N-terminal domain-containing protein, partial [Planctomycetota bacterium]